MQASQKLSAISENIENAESQLRKRLGLPDMESVRGLIAIDASKIYHLDPNESPRYPKPQIGNALLPEFVLAAQTEADLNLEMNNALSIS
jgi:hypothetical protein